MIKKKNILFTLIFIALISSFSNVQRVLGESRNVLLTNFISESQSIHGGFNEFPVDNQEITLEATRAAMSILDSLNKMEEIDIEDAEDWISTGITSFLNTGNNSGAFSLALESLQYIDGIQNLGTSPISRIQDYLNSVKEVLNNDSIGYSLNEEEEPSIFETYSAISCYYYLGNNTPVLITSEIEVLEVSNFIISCLDSSGGFKSDLTNESNPNLLNTFFAIYSLDLLDKLGDLTLSQRSEISNYINSFYVDEAFTDDLGGYSFENEGVLPTGSLFATYLATRTLNILNGSVPTEDTVNWVLNHQNIFDGGFSEVDIQAGTSNSSIISSYHAVEILKLNNPSLSILNVEMRGTKVNWGLILGITIPSIVLVIAGIIFYKRKNAL